MRWHQQIFLVVNRKRFFIGSCFTAMLILIVGFSFFFLRPADYVEVAIAKIAKRTSTIHHPPSILF
jgi:hypothetical protein